MFCDHGLRFARKLHSVYACERRGTQSRAQGSCSPWTLSSVVCSVVGLRELLSAELSRASRSSVFCRILGINCGPHAGNRGFRYCLRLWGLCKMVDSDVQLWSRMLAVAECGATTRKITCSLPGCVSENTHVSFFHHFSGPTPPFTTTVKARTSQQQYFSITTSYGISRTPEDAVTSPSKSPSSRQLIYRLERNPPNKRLGFFPLTSKFFTQAH